MPGLYSVGSLRHCTCTCSFGSNMYMYVAKLHYVGKVYVHVRSEVVYNIAMMFNAWQSKHVHSISHTHLC